MRYLEIDCGNAARPFAAELFLLEESGLTEPVFMLWRTEPTLMVGRFQNIAAEINVCRAAEKKLTVVRRKSGGGTIFTDPGGYQYSYVIPGAGADKVSFRENSAPVVEALRALGIPAEFNERNDILVEGKKVSGTARYRGKNGIVHHGSLLYDTDLEEMVRSLTPDDEKLVSKGIRSVRQRVTNMRPYMKRDMPPEAFKAELLRLVLGETPDLLTLPPRWEARIEEIRRDVFESWDWNWGENPSYSVTRSRRFPGGKVEVSFDSAGGRITNCVLRGDFFFEGDLEALTGALRGCPLKEADIVRALEESGQTDRFFRIDAKDIASLFTESRGAFESEMSGGIRR